MKKLLSLFAVLLVAFSVSAQVIEKPYIESRYKAAVGAIDIVEITITEDATLVMLETNTPRNVEDMWISFSSKTTLTYPGHSYQIEAWGLWDVNELQTKEFDTQYGMGPGKCYNLVLIFPTIPADVDKISIEENFRDGFYWRGIHLTSSDSANSEAE